MIDVAQRKAQLEQRLAELNARLQGIEKTLETEPNRDFEDFATEHEDDEVLEDLGSKGLHEIRMIQAALGRIAEDEYGFCQKCGEEIADERLDILPATPFCRTCAAQGAA